MNYVRSRDGQKQLARTSLKVNKSQLKISTDPGRYVMYGELFCTQSILYHFIYIMSYIKLYTAK